MADYLDSAALVIEMCIRDSSDFAQNSGGSKQVGQDVNN